METQRHRDTRAEIQVRRRLHARGYRFRVDAKPDPDLRVRGDIVWKTRKVVVFIDGCFWHRCPEHGTLPKRNADWWREKLAANVARDSRYEDLLRTRGWAVLRFWEHEDSDAIVDRIAEELERRQR